MLLVQIQISTSRKIECYIKEASKITSTVTAIEGLLRLFLSKQVEKQMSYISIYSLLLAIEEAVVVEVNEFTLSVVVVVVVVDFPSSSISISSMSALISSSASSSNLFCRTAFS